MKLTKEDINIVLESMEYNKENFRSKRKEDCFNKEETLKKMDKVIIKLKKMKK